LFCCCFVYRLQIALQCFPSSACFLVAKQTSHTKRNTSRLRRHMLLYNKKLFKYFSGRIFKPKAIILNVRLLNQKNNNDIVYCLAVPSLNRETKLGCFNYPSQYEIVRHSGLDCWSMCG
jgi:hypothetical protein